jgi:protoporphyrinogen oxidase
MALPLSTTFLVIGAGPAGLATAARLRELGYYRVTVLEKEAQVGGKCLSLLDSPGSGQAPHVYDLGANLTTPRYVQLRELADRLGLHLQTTADRRVVTVDPASPVPAPTTLQKLVLRLMVPVYSLVRSTTGIDRPGYVGLRDSVHLPFRTWLSRHFLGVLEPLFQTLFTSYGYGHVMDLPAIYALKFFDRTHFDAAVRVATGQAVEFTTEFQEGFQELWLRLVQHCGLDVRCGVEIVRIHRHGPEGQIQAWWRDAEGKLERLAFDRLVLACPLQDVAPFMARSPDERDLFDQIQTFDYWVTVARVAGLPDKATYVLPYANEIRPGWPTVYYPPVSGQDGVYTFYAYGGQGVDQQVVQDRIQQTVADWAIGHGQVTEILTTKHWRYFPHVQDTRHFYDVLDLLQGRDNTWYVGEVLSFTLTELVWEHARTIVDRMVQQDYPVPIE